MSILTSIKEKIREYIDVYIKLLKVNFIEHTANLVSYFLFTMICLFIVFGIILFTGFGISEAFIAMGLPKLAAFFITVGVYILLLVLTIACRKGITKFFAGSVISAMTDQSNDDEDE